MLLSYGTLYFFFFSVRTVHVCNFDSYSGVPVPPLQLRRHCAPQCQLSFPLQIKRNHLCFKTQCERFESPREIAPSCQKVKIPDPFWRWTQISSRPRGGCWKWRRWWDCLFFDRTFELLTCTGTICVQGRVGMKCLKDMLPATFIHFSFKAHVLHFVAVCERDWLVSWKGSRNECLRNKWCETSERSVPLSLSEREENNLKFKSTKSYTWCQSIQVQLALTVNHLFFHFCLVDFLRGVCVFHRSSAPEVQCSCSLGVPDDHVHAVVVPVQTQQDADLLLLASRCEWFAQHLQNSFISATVMTSTCRCVLWNESGLSSSGKAESFQQAVASGTFTTWLKHTGWVWLEVHVLIFWTIKCSFACFWALFFFCLHRIFSTLCLQRSTLPSSARWPWRHTGSLERCSEG